MTQYIAGMYRCSITFPRLTPDFECLLWLWILMSHRTSLSISLFMSGIIDQLFRRGGANLTFFAITMDIKNLFADLSTVYFNPWVGYMLYGTKLKASVMKVETWLEADAAAWRWWERREGNGVEWWEWNILQTTFNSTSNMSQHTN